jgi:hypothetical protein
LPRRLATKAKGGRPFGAARPLPDKDLRYLFFAAFFFAAAFFGAAFFAAFFFVAIVVILPTSHYVLKRKKVKQKKLRMFQRCAPASNIREW